MIMKNWKTKEQVITQMKKEVLECMSEGQIPFTASSFSELHEYIDANELGGFCDDDCPHDSSSDEDTAFINDCQGAIDEWLRSTEFRKKKRAYRKQHGIKGEGDDLDELGHRNYLLISSGVKIRGTFDPDEIMYIFEEQLYIDEIPIIREFLTWVAEDEENRRFGFGNYEERFKEFLESKDE